MAASGMAIVSTRHCDIPGVVLDGQTGLLAPERDVEQIAAHIMWFARHPGAWPPILAKGRCHIEAEFNCATQGRRLTQLYRELLEAPLGRQPGAPAGPNTLSSSPLDLVAPRL